VAPITSNTPAKHVRVTQTGLTSSTLFSAFAILVLVACGIDLPEASSAQRVRIQCSHPTSDIFYFPEDSLIPSGKSDDLAQRQAASRYLAAVDAPSLSCGDGAVEAYRLLWIHAFGSALIVSVAGSEGVWFAESMEPMSPRTGPRLAIEQPMRRELTDADTARLRESLRAAQFWTTAVWSDSGAHDGAVWIIEGRLTRGYRVVSRGNPTDTTDRAFKNAARTLLRLADVAIPREME
jgi:hypothetical protein